MTNELQKIVELIHQNDNIDAAFVEITGEYGDASGISGNPQGLRLLAAELIQKSIEMEQGSSTHVDLAHHNWLLSEGQSFTIFPEVNDRDTIINERQQTHAVPASSNAGGIGCGIVLLALVGLIFLGLIFLIRLF